MDEAKRKLLETTLQSRFDLQRFIRLTRELLKSPKINSNPTFTEAVMGQFRGSVQAYTEFGRYTDSEDKELLLLAVRLRRDDSVARSRAMQRNFVKERLQKKNADAALVAFFEPSSQDWRISFVKIDYNFVGNALEEKITPARRYSFLVGENEKSHTAMRQLALIIENDSHSPTLTEIEEIFNIEKVTDEFFKVYKEKYLDLKECLEAQAEFISMAQKLNFTGEEFAKKLMGQLSFLYFLQRKGWLGVTANPKSIPAAAAEQLLTNKPSNLRDLFKKVYTLKKDRYERSTTAFKDLSDQQIMTLNFIFVNTPYEGKWGTGEKNFIRKIFNNADKNELVFYKDYLEPLFYNALNEKRGDNTYYRPFNCMIPFLNGGLFQTIVDGYDMSKARFIIPNSLFSNSNITKDGDKGDGILDIFDRYAFTVKEDEPLEKEVAVDPEMLGKVFENLLEVKDRKSKGAYYTPREIVHYMCQESLINYLVTDTGISYEDINKLICYGDMIADVDNSVDVGKVIAGKYKEYLMPESIRKNAKKVDDALDDIRIADPAVGSGAFPLGMINEIVRARMNLTRYLIPEEYTFLRDYAIPDKRKPYNLKLRTIQHSIHAVDIERSAVEITKLRLWLSLVVDEESFSEIRPLPNLEYNIMCGNSLLEEFEGIKLFNEALLDHHSEIAAVSESNVKQLDIFTSQSQNILDGIYGLQEKFFATSDSKEKIELKKRIDKQEWDLIEKSLIENGKANELSRILEMKRLNSKPYFLWKLNFAKVFHDKGGFDVVIGNPPYVKEYTNSTIFQPLKGSPYYQGKMDFWYLFACVGIDLLNSNGIEAYIAPNNWITNAGASILRNKVLKETAIQNFIDFGNYKVFDTAAIQTMVYIIRKKIKVADSYNLSYSKLFEEKFPRSFLNVFLYNDKSCNSFEKRLIEFCPSDYFNKYINFSNDISTSVLNSIKAAKSAFLNKNEIAQGIVAPQENLNKANQIRLGTDFSLGEGIFVLTNSEVDKLNIPEHEKVLIKPFYTTEQFQRYKSNPINEYKIIYTKSDISSYIHNYPVIKRHLDRFSSIITSDNKPYGLHRARDERFFIGEKIVSVRKCLKPRFSYVNFDAYVSQTFNVIKSTQFKAKYLVGILNSKLIEFWLLNMGKMQGNNFQIDKEPLINIPIAIPKKEMEQKIINIVENIMISENANTTNLEKQIDQMVYELYGLTDNEVKVVEEALKVN